MQPFDRKGIENADPRAEKGRLNITEPGQSVHSWPAAFKPLSLLLFNFPRPSPLNPCLPLPVRISARASASRLADLRALAPIGARGHISSRIDQLIPAILYSASMSLSRDAKWVALLLRCCRHRCMGTLGKCFWPNL